MKLKNTVRDKTIGRIEIANNIRNDLQLSKSNSLLIVEIILFYIIKNIKNDKYLSIVNFGRFKLHSKKERWGTNPKTSEKILIPQMDCILFHYSKYLKHFLNNSKVKFKKSNFSNEISKELHEHLNNLGMDLNHLKCSLAVNILFKTIITELKRNSRIELRNFGTIGTRILNARKLRNPKTGEIIITQSKKVPFFRYSKHIFN